MKDSDLKFSFLNLKLLYVYSELNNSDSELLFYINMSS